MLYTFALFKTMILFNVCMHIFSVERCDMLFDNILSRTIASCANGNRDSCKYIQGLEDIVDCVKTSYNCNVFEDSARTICERAIDISKKVYEH